MRPEIPPNPLPGVEVEGKKKVFGEVCPDAEVEAAVMPCVWLGESERYELESGRDEQVDEVDEGADIAGGALRLV